MSTASSHADNFDFPDDDFMPDDYDADYTPRDISTAPSARPATPARMAAVIPMPLPAPKAPAAAPAAKQTNGIFGNVPDPHLIPQAAAMKMTDMGIGARLVIHYTGRLAYRKSLRGGSWMSWTGTNWAEDADQGVAAEHTRTVIASISEEEVQWAATSDPAVQDLEKRIARSNGANLPTADLREALAEAKDKAVKNRLDFGLKSENGNSHINSAIDAARPSLTVNEDKFDSHPYLINFPNGTLDARTGVLSPHSPTDYLTKVTSADYVPGATHEDLDMLVKTLERTDPGIALFLKRFLGYCLLGISTAKMFYGIKGDADAGKSTLWLAFADALGEESQHGYARIVSPKLFATSSRDVESAQENLHSIMGARFVFADESESGFMDRLTMTNMSSGGPFRTRGLHGKPVAWRSQATIVMAGNDFMPMPDNDAGIRRRFVGTELTHQLTEDEMDMGLAERVATPEFREAILAFAVEGAMDFLREGADRAALKITPLMEATSREILGGMDPLAAFWEACVIEGDEGSFEDYVPMNTTQWYARYQQFCKAHEIKSDMTINHLSKRLTDRGAIADKTLSRHYINKGTEHSKEINKGKFRRGIRYTGATTANWVDLFETF